MAYQTYSGPAAQAGAATGRPARRIRPGFGLRGPRRERHVLEPADLAAFCFPVGDDGVLIGEDPERHPAVLGLFRPTAYDVVLVGGIWTAQLIALRAAATGARVAVETARPQLWAPMAQAAGGGQPCVTVHQIGRLGAQGASVAAPVLVVRDLGPRPPRSRLSASPWQSTVTVLPYLGPNASRVLNAADLVGVQRVSPQEAELVGRVLSFAPADVAALPTLSDDITLWASRMRRQYVRLEPGSDEYQVLGPARRVD
ncbi:hypothetical protein ACFW1A_16870 [Kitasatospora sp. NPDC058965]|uniref:hypothetical protein n=1 Tax=Kitasatospora sp. NPDC058965 TaxID=3346682 RepID=UPI0036AEC36F